MSKAKGPLMTAGAAIAGTAGAMMIKNRVDASKSPLKKLRRVSLPKPNGRLDAGAVRTAAERLSSFGTQAAEIAGAIEKTQKKNN